jgi:hypothetical protein
MQAETFFQLTKFDPFSGIAIGIAAAEELDHTNEILDYHGSKPAFKAWSDTQHKLSGGKSYGNIRLQHDDKKPVGILTSPPEFDDLNKKVKIETLIVDKTTKDLLSAGVLTGFSIGGSYASRTPLSNGFTKYVPNLAEISVCDRPCAPSATFSVVKAGGGQELRKFYKPTDQNLPNPDQILKMTKLAKSGYSVSVIAAACNTTMGQVTRALSLSKTSLGKSSQTRSEWRKGHYRPNPFG